MNETNSPEQITVLEGLIVIVGVGFTETVIAVVFVQFDKELVPTTVYAVLDNGVTVLTDDVGPDASHV